MNLGDLLGAILSEATLARVHADLEAARVAELYASHPMLEGAPIPRFRLPEFTVNVPVVIKDTSGGTNPPLLALHDPPGRNQLAAGIRHAADESGLSIAAEEEKLLLEKLSQELKERWRDPLDFSAALKSVKRIGELASRILLDIRLPRRQAPKKTKKVKKTSSRSVEETRLSAETTGEEEAEKKAASGRTAAQIKTFSKELQRNLSAPVIGKMGESNRIEVVTNTSDIREIGDPRMLTTLNLKIGEDGFETVEIERGDGSKETRLVPE